MAEVLEAAEREEGVEVENDMDVLVVMAVLRSKVFVGPGYLTLVSFVPNGTQFNSPDWHKTIAALEDQLGLMGVFDLNGNFAPEILLGEGAVDPSLKKSPNGGVLDRMRWGRRPPGH